MSYPAGWYYDSEGQLRWWDGTQWAVAANAYRTQTADAATAPPGGTVSLIPPPPATVSAASGAPTQATIALPAGYDPALGGSSAPSYTNPYGAQYEPLPMPQWQADVEQPRDRRGNKRAGVVALVALLALGGGGALLARPITAEQVPDVSPVEADPIVPLPDDLGNLNDLFEGTGLNLDNLNLDDLNNLNLNDFGLGDINLDSLDMSRLDLDQIDQLLNLQQLDNLLHLEGLDLGDLNLEGFNLQDFNFDGLNLDGLNLDGLNLNDINIDGFSFNLDDF